MKVKYVMIIYAFVFCILLGIGLNTRLSYKDFNDEKEPLDNFVVGLMDKKMVESGIEMMSENLDKSNIILAVECKEDVKFRYSCATQKVEVKKFLREII